MEQLHSKVDKSLKEAYMMDNLIVALSINILGLWLIDYFDAHHFAIESLCAIVSTIMFLWMHRGDKGK